MEKDKMIINFGKYEGDYVEDLPSDYLSWLIKECDDEDIVIAAEEEYGYRDKYKVHFYED